MITFDPESPWEVGTLVTLRDGDVVVDRKVVASVESSGSETQYQLIDPRVWELRQQGVRPYVELG